MSYRYTSHIGLLSYWFALKLIEVRGESRGQGWGLWLWLPGFRVYPTDQGCDLGWVLLSGSALPLRKWGYLRIYITGWENIWSHSYKYLIQCLTCIMLSIIANFRFFTLLLKLVYQIIHSLTFTFSVNYICATLLLDCCVEAYCIILVMKICNRSVLVKIMRKKLIVQLCSKACISWIF